MLAQVIRPERFGEPKRRVPGRGDRAAAGARPDEVLVYVMAAGVNYNNVWAALGIPVDVIKARTRQGRRDRGLPHRRQRRVRHRLDGRQRRHEREGRRRGRHPLRHVGRRTARREGRRRPDVRATFRIWGYETNWGSFAQFTQGPGAPVPAQAEAPDVGGGRRAYMLVGATAYRMLMAGRRTPSQTGRRRADLGRRRRPRLRWRSRSRARSGGVPVAVVSGDDKVEFCKKLGANGCINRKEFDHWGMLPHWTDDEAYDEWLKGARAFGKAFWDALGERTQPAHRLRAPGRGHDPDVDLRVRHRRHGRDLRRHHRLQRRRRPALPLDAAEAPPGLALRERRRRPARFNELVLAGKVDPCLSQTFTFDEIRHVAPADAREPAPDGQHGGPGERDEGGTDGRPALRRGEDGDRGRVRHDLPRGRLGRVPSSSTARCSA